MLFRPLSFLQYIIVLVAKGSGPWPVRNHRRGGAAGLRAAQGELLVDADKAAEAIGPQKPEKCAQTCKSGRNSSQRSGRAALGSCRAASSALRDLRDRHVLDGEALVRKY
jgi:hypothetical protein